MLQLRRKLMNLMENQYQGRDGIMDEASNEKGHDNLERFEFVRNIILQNSTAAILKRH